MISKTKQKKVINSLMKKQIGRKSILPIGECFDNTGIIITSSNLHERLADLTICHGIGSSNLPNVPIFKIAHSWIEGTAGNNNRYVFDPTWGLLLSIKKYREDLTLEYIVTYTKDDYIAQWEKYGYPGPWDKKIKALCR
jgi:hypothetical protein